MRSVPIGDKKLFNRTRAYSNFYIPPDLDLEQLLDNLKNANKFTVIKYFEKVLRDFTNEDPLKKKSQDEASGLDPNATSEEIETLLKLAVDKGILSEEANMAFTLHLKQIKQLNQSFIKQDTQFQNLIDQLEILKNPFLAFIHEKDSQQIITNLKKLKESNDIAKQIQFVNLVREYFKLLKENPQEVIKIDKAEFLSMLDETVIGYEDSNLSDIFQGSRPVKINLTSLEYA